LNLRVPSWLYRLLWIAVAVIGAICGLGLILMLAFDGGVSINQGGPILIAAGVFGAVMFAYAIRRLLWPLKAPPRS
jgi:hypothetical protein